ncbi:MAG: Hpt domain-containing protein [Oscillospiraceae bacterium]|nr:Hpt domain-containing protein [Oscillospiraceae bacterium]MBR0063621.1 Hpt domain-containing protein [Oscillospiraceae bacterium]
MTVQELYEKIGGNFDAAKKILPSEALIGRFVVKLLKDGSMQKLRDGVAAGDGKAIFEGAHALKGVTANLGLQNISDLAAEIADEFRTGRERSLSDEELQAKLDELNAKFDAASEEIAKFQAQ